MLNEPREEKKRVIKREREDLLRHHRCHRYREELLIPNGFPINLNFMGQNGSPFSKTRATTKIKYEINVVERRDS